MPGLQARTPSGSRPTVQLASTRPSPAGRRRAPDPTSGPAPGRFSRRSSGFARRLALAGALLLAAAPASAGPAAIVSQVEGAVTLLAGADPVGVPARPLQPLAGGSTLRLGSGARALVLCADDHALELTGPTEWAATSSCTGGRVLTAGTFGRLVLPRGRVRSFHGSLLEEAPSRSDSAGREVPVLLSPRSPQRGSLLVATAAPEIRWRAVPSAYAYDLVIGRGGARGQARVEVSATACPVAPGERACRAAWPWPPLRPGQETQLRVVALTSDPDWPTAESDASRLTLAPHELRLTVEAELGAIDPSLPSATRELLRAEVYGRAELYNETAAALAASLEAQPQAGLAVRLGDLYQGLALHDRAASLYRRAEQLLPPRRGEDGVRAAVQMGLGRLYARRENPTAAARAFARAASLYERLGWTEELAEARTEAERAARSAP